MAAFASQPAPSRPSARQKELADDAFDAYIESLLLSIKAMDDGKTSAEVIARIAVMSNIDQLRKAMSIATANVSERSPLSAAVIMGELDKLPDQEDIDLATRFVLKHRKERAEKPRVIPHSSFNSAGLLPDSGGRSWHEVSVSLGISISITKPNLVSVSPPLFIGRSDT